MFYSRLLESSVHINKCEACTHGTAGSSHESPFVSTGGPLAVLADGSTQPQETDPAQLAKAFRPVWQLRVSCLYAQTATRISRPTSCQSQIIRYSPQGEHDRLHLCTIMQALAAVSAQYRAVQQTTAERLVAGLFARQASAPAEMLQAMIQGGAEDDLDVQARLALCPCLTTQHYAVAALALFVVS